MSTSGERQQRCNPIPSSSWNNLLPDMLTTIADCLDVTSSVQLSTVCTSWASTIRPRLPSFPPFLLDRPIPWLLFLPSDDQNSGTDPNSNRDRTNLTFYDVTTTTSYSVPVNFPLFADHCWLGSYKGWLVTLDHQLQIHLIKPLTGAHVLLPSVDSIRNEIPWKVVLCQTSDNIDESLVAFCLTEKGSLSAAKIGDEKWTSVTYTTPFCDIISYQEKVYAVSRFALCCYNPRSSFIHKPEMVININILIGWDKYLLEWRDELFMLFIYVTDYELSLEEKEASLNQVKLYKVNLFDVSNLLSHVSSLGNDALFYGANCSYAVSVSASSRDDIRKNCIYFTSHTYEDGAEGSHPNHNFAVFDLGLQTYTPWDQYVVPVRLPLPIWFWPR